MTYLPDTSNSTERLLSLRQQMLTCKACDLCETRSQVVFGEGAAKPQIMIIGEAPGEEEDERGIPFVGKAGQKLDSILSYVGVSRDEVYITNSVLCRPPNNRNPRADELGACRQRLELQIDILKPELIIVLGRIAMQQVMNKQIKGPLKQFFSEDWLEYKSQNHEVKMLVTYHPSYHLRSPKHAYKVTLPHWTKIKEYVRGNHE